MLWLNINIAGNARKIFTIVHSFSVRVKKKKKVITVEDVLIISRYGICEIPRIACEEKRNYENVFFFSLYINLREI